MAASTSNLVCDNSTLANFKSWAQAIGTALAAFGWTQTTDTGQVNWSSISTVPSNAYVYEVWKANDTQASTLPIYLKMEYGYSSTTPQLRASTGTGSSGAGVLTGGLLTSAPWTLTNSVVNHGGSTYPCFFSGNAGEFRMYLWQSPAIGIGTVFGVERSKDASGANTTDYFTTLCCTNSTIGSNAYQQSTLSATLVGNRETGIIVPCLTNGSGTGAFNGTVASFPVFPVLGKVGNPMLGFQVCAQADVSDGSTVSVASFYAATHTMVAVTGTDISAALGVRSWNATSMALLMRYE